MTLAGGMCRVDEAYRMAVYVVVWKPCAGVSIAPPVALRHHDPAASRCLRQRSTTHHHSKTPKQGDK